MDRKTLQEQVVEIKTTVKITHEDLYSLVVSAFEGGSNYWYMVESDISVDKDNVYDYWKDITGKGIVVSNRKIIEDELEGDKLVEKTLTLETLKEAVQVMAEKYDWHFENLAKENADAETGDVFLQCFLFGELVYG